MPVLVYGHGGNGEPFLEQAETRVANAHGALLALAPAAVFLPGGGGTLIRPAVCSGQSLILMNPRTEEEVECLVRSVEPDPSAGNLVAVEFATASPNFWEMASPPVDWNANERKQPQDALPTDAGPKG